MNIVSLLIFLCKYFTLLVRQTMCTPLLKRRKRGGASFPTSAISVRSTNIAELDYIEKIAALYLLSKAQTNRDAAVSGSHG